MRAYQTNFWKYVLIIFMIIGLIGVPTGVWAAGLGNLGLNTTVTYDIYFGSDETSTNVIRDAKLIRTAKIDGKTFLVIEVDALKLNPSEGFVRFDSILAFLPHKAISVQNL